MYRGWLVWGAMAAVEWREFAVAVGVMTTFVGSAAVAGHRTGGRSGLYQGALNGFGLHALVHLAQAAALRGHTPGSVTSPLIVLPFVLPFAQWARRRQRRTGVLKPARARDIAMGPAVAAGGPIAMSHAVARRVVGRT